jgi:signal peptidase I
MNMSKQDKKAMVRNTGLQLLSEGKSIRIKAHGFSMYPCIRPGSLILIEPIQVKGAPVPGEIIAIETENGIIIHRLTSIILKNNSRMFIARGDSNSFADSPIKIDKIAGRVVGATTTGENKIPADVRINTHPHYFLNRLRVIGLHLWKKIKQ